jgi:peroxiredoxin
MRNHKSHQRLPETTGRRSSDVWFGLMVVGTVLIVGAAAGLLWINAQAANAGGSVTGPVRVGMEMPDFSLPDLDGNMVRLKDFRGKPVLINAWATWCPPCRYEMPDLHAYYLEHQPDGLVVLAINAGETREQAAAFAQNLGLTFPVLLDENEALMDALSIRDYPTSILVGADGRVMVVHIGLFSPEQMEQKLTPHLAPAPADL